MPAKKPNSLNKRHSTKKELAARKDAEGAMVPLTVLTSRPPARLRGHADAIQTWKWAIGLYNETKDSIITAFDAPLLVKYCLAQEELIELEKLRGEIKKQWDKSSKFLNKINVRADMLKDYYNALNQSNALLARYQGFDARIDGKRKMLLAMEQSLYLTPRSRAGVAPAEKDPEPEKSDMEDALDE